MTYVGERGISIVGLGALDALQRIDSRLAAPAAAVAAAAAGGGDGE
jgi:hypothetical protein